MSMFDKTSTESLHPEQTKCPDIKSIIQNVVTYIGNFKLLYIM